MADTLSLIANVHVTRRHPVSLIHFVTNRCNARCSFCFIDFDDPNTFRGELTVDEIDQLTRTTGPHLQNVNLTGGEPFARKEILEIARCWFRNSGIRSMFITSNGSLPDRMEPFARTLTSEFPGRKLIFSLSVDAFAERHDSVRKIKGLFDNVLDSYHRLRKLGGDVMANIGITVSHENFAEVDDLYESLIRDHGVRAITATLVRDEGVYEIPTENKRDIVAAYSRLTKQIQQDLKSGRLDGFDTASLQGRLMNKKNVIVNRKLTETYLDPHYISPCRAGSLFGVIGAEGTIYPCEILDRPLGNVRDYGGDFSKLWAAAPARETRDWIKDTNCHCTYECAWSFNVLSNARYQPSLIAAALGKYW